MKTGDRKQKVEDRVAREDAQEAAATPGSSTDQANFYSPPVKQFSADTPLVIQGSAVDNPFWRDEPAPQWLIEEALNRGPKINPEIIISDLEKKLRSARAELADALNEQLLIKNKYKKALKNLKISADEERDEMQRKIVKICTSIFEKCTKKIRCHKKHQKPLQHFGKLSKQLHKKLRIASLTSAKLKREVLSAKQDLQEKSRQYDSLAKNFENLKFELKNAEININELRKENESLRKGIEDTREWMQTRVSKERHEKINSAQFREIQRSRELTNLKKKSEEDISTIVQLRSKLLRLESANSNKGFLITNYKSQLVDLNSEKDKLLSKIKELENENSQLRNNNAQLKASVTLISDEKEKMHSEKSESEIIERMQSKLATKYERSMLQRVDAMKTKYEKIVVSLQDKLRASENSVSQYFEAIKRFLKNIHEHHRQLDTERDLSCSEASEREAHETACSILNITPFELTGFLNGNPLKTVNSWLTEVQKLTSRKNFAEDLGKFLFARAIGSDRSKSII